MHPVASEVCHREERKLLHKKGKTGGKVPALLHSYPLQRCVRFDGACFNIFRRFSAAEVWFDIGC